MWPEWHMKSWRGKSCWLHSRESIPEVDQKLRALMTSLTVLDTVLVWNRQNYHNLQKTVKYSESSYNHCLTTLPRKSEYYGEWMETFVVFTTVLIFSSCGDHGFIGLHLCSGLFKIFPAIRNLLLLEHEQQVTFLYNLEIALKIGNNFTRKFDAWCIWIYFGPLRFFGDEKDINAVILRLNNPCLLTGLMHSLFCCCVQFRWYL